MLAELESMEAAADRQRARCAEVDPVSGKPRFGPKMMARVKAATERHEELLMAARAALEADATGLRAAMEADVEAELAAQDAAALAEEQAKQTQEQEARQAADAEAAAAAADAAAAVEAQQRKAALHKAAEISRVARRQEQAAAAEAAKAADAVRKAAIAQLTARVHACGTGAEAAATGLALLREECAAGLMPFHEALADLRTMADNISTHPDEQLFRRLRCGNPKVQALTGSLDREGAMRVLAAMGFGITEDAAGEPVFSMEEPNLEADMDGWSAWFDNLSAVRKALHDETLE